VVLVVVVVMMVEGKRMHNLEYDREVAAPKRTPMIVSRYLVGFGRKYTLLGAYVCGWSLSARLHRALVGVGLVAASGRVAVRADVVEESVGRPPSVVGPAPFGLLGDAGGPSVACCGCR
jgi:hypothetical protein